MHAAGPLTCQAVEPAPLPPAPPVQSALARSVAELLDRYSASIARTVAAMNEQGGGIMRLVVVDEGMWQYLVAHRGDGNAVAALSHSLVEVALVARQQGRADALTRCGKCGCSLQDSPFHIVCVLPECPAPEAGLTLAICVGCGVAWPEVKAAAWEAIAPVFGGIRVFGPQPDVVGHA